MSELPTIRFITPYEANEELIDRFVEAMLPEIIGNMHITGPAMAPDEVWNELIAKKCYALAYALVDEKVRRQGAEQ